MTKKDFELIANVFRNQYTGHGSPEWVRESLAVKMAEALATTNPKFDRARFLAACGVRS